MKKALIFVVICLLPVLSTATQNKNFGFTGEIRIETLPIPVSLMNIQDFSDIKGDAALSGKVKMLSIGAKKSGIFNPIRPNYNLYDYYYLTFDEWWVGAVVVNFDNIDHDVTLMMTAKGASETQITREFTIKANHAKVVAGKFVPDYFPRLYFLTGFVNGETIAPNRVSTKLYIFDVF